MLAGVPSLQRGHPQNETALLWSSQNQEHSNASALLNLSAAASRGSVVTILAFILFNAKTRLLQRIYNRTN